MPYDVEKAKDVSSMKEKLQKTYKGVSDKAVRQAIHIFNSIMDNHNDEGRAWAGVYSQMNARGLSKKKASTEARRLLIRHAHTYQEDRGAILGFLRRAGWIPGDLKDDNATWSPGHLIGDPKDYEEDGSQVPPKRDSYGQERDENNDPQDSIERVAQKFLSRQRK